MYDIDEIDSERTGFEYTFVLHSSPLLEHQSAEQVSAELTRWGAQGWELVDFQVVHQQGKDGAAYRIRSIHAEAAGIVLRRRRARVLALDMLESAPTEVEEAHSVRLQNWAGTLSLPDGVKLIPRVGQDLPTLVADVRRLADEGFRIRAVGAYYSFSECTVPKRPVPGALRAVIWWRPHFKMRLDDPQGRYHGNEQAKRALLTACLRGDELRQPTALALAIRGKTDEGLGACLDWSDASAGGYAFFRPAARIDDACVALRWLAELGDVHLAPFSLGGSTGQTFIGAMSTGTHGADFDRGPICNEVMALQVVTRNREVWVQDATSPVPEANREKLRALVELDSLVFETSGKVLDALRVALGHGGVIVGALFRLRSTAGAGTERELMNERFVARLWNDVKTSLRVGPTDPLFTKPPAPFTDPARVTGRYLELMINPFAATPAVYVISRVTRHTAEPPSAEEPRPSLEAQLIQIFLEASTDSLPGLSRVMDLIAEGTRMRGTDSAGRPYWRPTNEIVRVGIPTPISVHSFELVWPIGAEITDAQGRTERAFIAFIDRFIELAREWRPRAITTLRFCRSTSALIGMQHGAAGAVFAHVEIGFLRPPTSPRMEPGAQAVYVRLMQHPSVRENKDVRVHWGQCIMSPIEGLARLSHVAGQSPAWRDALRQLHGTAQVPQTWRDSFSTLMGFGG